MKLYMFRAVLLSIIRS